MKKIIRYQIFRVDEYSAHPHVAPVDFGESNKVRESPDLLNQELEKQAKVFSDIRNNKYVVLPVISFEE